MNRVSIDRDRPEDAPLALAVQALRAGWIVAFPTDTLYGLAVDPRNSGAVESLYEVKGRSAEKALPLVAADVAQVVRCFGSLSPAANRLAQAFWPGPLSLILPAPPDFAIGVHGGTGSVAVRVPSHAVARSLASRFDCPVTATSANASGRPATSEPDEVESAFGSSIAVLLDAGRSPGGEPSTIVDVSGPSARLVRAGAIAWDRVLRCLNEP